MGLTIAQLPAATIEGVDYSNHQAEDYTPGSNKAFAFILGTDGHTWKSPTFDKQMVIILKVGKVPGSYHWLRHGNIAEQAKWYADQINPKPGQIIAVDWEQAGTTNADKDAMIKELQKLFPKNRVGLYCNKNFWINYDRTSYCGDFLWIAEIGVVQPTIQHEWKFWQKKFGSGLQGPDLDVGNFPSKAALEAWANFAETPAPSPAPVAPVEVTVIPVYPSLDQIRTPFGAWGTSWSWNRQTSGPHKGEGQHGGDDWHRNAGMAEIGDPVYAVADGEIIYAADARADGGQGWGRDFGIHTLLKWDTGGRTSVDGHMSKLHVKAGDKVKAGDLIGEKGMTGNVTGPHVHHEDHLGTKWTDPRVKPIYPGIKVVTPVQEETLIMAKPKQYKRLTDQKIPANKGWVALKVDDNDDNKYGLTHGPATLDIHAIIRSDVDILARFVTLDWKPGASKMVFGFPQETLKADGDHIRLYDHIGGPAKGYTQRIVHLEVFAPDGANISQVISHVGRLAG